MPATTPGSRRAVSGASGGPNRSESMTATGRAPIVRMSRTMPPTPVAAPWYGSTNDGWLCDSILNVTAQPSPASTTPAFSPMPTSSASVFGALSANCFRWILDDLYEQCSLHMTEYMVSSELVGRRPRICLTRAYSSSLSPSSAYGCSCFDDFFAIFTVSIICSSRERSSRCPIEKGDPVGAGAGERLDGVLGMRHQADDIAGGIGDSGDVAQA